MNTVYTVTAKDPAELSAKLTHKYSIMAEFLTDNQLKVNDEKTHLLVMTTRQKPRYVQTSDISITTPTATISPSTEERLLVPTYTRTCAGGNTSWTTRTV